jgi:hypothetical protein
MQTRSSLTGTIVGIVVLLVLLALVIAAAQATNWPNYQNNTGQTTTGTNPPPANPPATPPPSTIDAAGDAAKKQEISTILNAISSFITANDGDNPTYDNKTLPVVTVENVYTAGVGLELLDDIVPDHLPNFPTGYKVGVLASGKVIVAVKLSDGSIFTKTL